MIEINIKKRQKKTIPRTTEMGKNHHYAADKNQYKKPVQFGKMKRVFRYLTAEAENPKEKQTGFR